MSELEILNKFILIIIMDYEEGEDQENYQPPK
jgi:hypothetical protein